MLPLPLLSLTEINAKTVGMVWCMHVQKAAALLGGAEEVKQMSGELQNCRDLCFRAEAISPQGFISLPQSHKPAMFT